MRQMKMLLNKTIYIMNRPQKLLCVLVFLLTCVGSILECLGVSIIIPLVTAIQDPAIIMNNDFVKGVELLASLTYNQMIALICGGVIVLYAFKNVYFIFLAWVRVKFSCKIEREMSVKMLSSYLSRGYQYFLNMNYGEFSRGIMGDPSAVFSVLYAVLRLASEILTIFLICIFMFIADYKLAFTVVMLALICLAVVFFIFRKNMYEAGVKIREYSARTGQTVSQIFLGVKDVLLLRKQKYFIYEYEEDRIGTQSAQCKQAVGAESPTYIIEAICISGLMLAVCMRIIAGGNDPQFFAVLAAFAVGAFRVLPSLGKISTSLNALTNAIPSVDVLYNQVVCAEEYLKQHPEAVIELEPSNLRYGLISKGRKNSAVSKSNCDNSEQDKFKDSLELRNISFQYTPELGDVLKNISLTIKKGQSIALIGESGAGKSTLVDVLLGLLVPQEGTVYMDGVKITDNPDKWADTIGYVPQALNLASTSIRKNVAFGISDSEIDIDRVYEALERAELGEFIKTLPQGIETMVGDRGVRLSGGQRQRIAIARALYHRPEILVLDEATSALDNDTESAIMSAIDSLQGQVTMIIVAHRLTTVKNCDFIYEVKKTELILRDKSEVLDGII